MRSSVKVLRLERLSEVVNIEMSTSPFSFPILQHQDTDLAAVPCNVLVIFLVEMILKMDP
jgi:hypothetical protein